ncbi:MAG: hypothetical protein ACI3XA_03325 [Clostridia bacterium]
MKKKTIGIIMIVIGVMAFLGSFFQAQSPFAFRGLSDIFAVLIMIALVVGGIVFVIKDKSAKK